MGFMIGGVPATFTRRTLCTSINIQIDSIHVQMNAQCTPGHYTTRDSVHKFQYVVQLVCLVGVVKKSIQNQFC